MRTGRPRARGELRHGRVDGVPRGMQPPAAALPDDDDSWSRVNLALTRSDDSRAVFGSCAPHAVPAVPTVVDNRASDVDKPLREPSGAHRGADASCAPDAPVPGGTQPEAAQTQPAVAPIPPPPPPLPVPAPEEVPCVILWDASSVRPPAETTPHQFVNGITGLVAHHRAELRTTSTVHTHQDISVLCSGCVFVEMDELSQDSDTDEQQPPPSPVHTYFRDLGLRVLPVSDAPAFMARVLGFEGTPGETTLVVVSADPEVDRAVSIAGARGLLVIHVSPQHTVAEQEASSPRVQRLSVEAVLHHVPECPRAPYHRQSPVDTTAQQQLPEHRGPLTDAADVDAPREGGVDCPETREVAATATGTNEKSTARPVAHDANGPNESNGDIFGGESDVIWPGDASGETRRVNKKNSRAAPQTDTPTRVTDTTMSSAWMWITAAAAAACAYVSETAIPAMQPAAETAVATSLVVAQSSRNAAASAADSAWTVAGRCYRYVRSPEFTVAWVQTTSQALDVAGEVSQGVVDMVGWLRDGVTEATALSINRRSVRRVHH